MDHVNSYLKQGLQIGGLQVKSNPSCFIWIEQCFVLVWVLIEFRVLQKGHAIFTSPFSPVLPIVFSLLPPHMWLHHPPDPKAPKCATSELRSLFNQQKKIITWRKSPVLFSFEDASSNDFSQEVLKKELGRLEEFFQCTNTCHLPLNPALCIKGIDGDVSQHIQ